MSPRQARNYAMEYWPAWMKKEVDAPYWIGLDLPERLSSLHRADESGNLNRDGRHFVVITKTTKLSK